jgi:3',5'-nucleoside bisphosphate phosphatase
MLLDLHAHSNASDGSLSPEELVDHAISRGLGTLALCDHDTTGGIARFLSHGKGKDIRLISGVELSATWGKGNCHILGLNVRTDYAPLEEVLSAIRDSRDNRNEKIIAKLNELGLDITLDEVSSLAGGDVVARPHMARVMLSKGYVESVQEAFDKYLAKGSPAYIDRYRLEPERAAQLLREAGATVVLAHPTQLKIDIDGLEALVEKLLPYGLAGMEIYTPYSSDDEIEAFLAVVRKHNLLITGGSDFHGESKPAHKLGYYRDDVLIPKNLAL